MRPAKPDATCSSVAAVVRHELLNALAVRIGRVDRALRVDDDAVDPVELARAQALLAPRRDELAVLQRQLVHTLQRVIGNERKAIIALARNADVPRIPSRTLISRR